MPVVYLATLLTHRIVLHILLPLYTTSLFIQIFFIDIVFNKLSTLLCTLSVSTCVGSYHKDNRNFCAVSHKGLTTCSASTTPVVNSMYSTDAVSNPSMIGSLSVLSNLSHSLAVSSVNIIQL